MLLESARAAGSDLWFEASVADLCPAEEGAGWRVRLEGSAEVAAAAVVVATGGLSVPKTGSDGTGLRIVERLGHSLHTTYPALTPLTADPARHAPLAGVSLDVALSAPLPRGRFTTEGGFLFTHRGYSGPSVLNVSHLAVRSRMRGEERQPILVQWTELDAGAWERALLEGPGTTVGAVVRRSLPYGSPTCCSPRPGWIPSAPSRSFGGRSASG